MDFIASKSLSGKYFINAIRTGEAHADQPQQRGVIRGKILGPVATELSPFYLCDLYPADNDAIAITAQTIIPLEALVGVYLYQERDEFNAAWLEIQRAMLRAAKAEAKARRLRAKQQAEMFAAALKSQGIQTVQLGQPDPIELGKVLGEIIDRVDETDGDE